MNEQRLQAVLDADPTLWTARIQLAELLNQDGDPRAPGYYALGCLRIAPARLESGFALGSNCNPSTAAFLAYQNCFLPDDWFYFIHPYTKSHFEWWCTLPTRREADDAAALAFRRLKRQRWRELLERK